MDKNKYNKVTFRVTQEEKTLLEQASFMKCIPISDIIREGLKLYFKDDSAFETGTERKSRQWKI